MHEALRWFSLALGLAIVLGTLASVFTTLVVPRATSSRFLWTVTKLIGRVTIRMVRFFPSYESRDRVIAVVGPFCMVVLFVAWLSVLLLGFGFILWWSGTSDLGHALAASGSSVFTLGFTTVPGHFNEAVEIIAAGAGLLVIALEIAYLPAMYNAFSNREADVTLLATRSGVPAWGPEILTRHQAFGLNAELPDLYASWERWAAAMGETHTNYPTLMWFRSPVPMRSWLTALTAMLDAAALQSSINPSTAPFQTRVLLQMGTNALRSLVSVLKLEYDPDPLPTTPIRLTYDEFLAGVARLEAVDFPFERTPEEAWPHFCGWRVNYEPLVDALTVLVAPPPAPWFLDRPWLGQVPRPSVVNRTPEHPEGDSLIIRKSG